MEEIDIAFNHWWNQAQPLAAIMKETGSHVFREEEAKAVKAQIKHAFTHGWARGLAAEAARFPPEDPNLGPVR